MSAERRKVLDLLAAGKITAEEAERLLNRLDPSTARETATDGEATGDGREPAGRRRPRFLRVQVDSPRHDTVNIRLPLGILRSGLKWSTMMPRRVSERLAERGVDLSHLGGLDDEELVAELTAQPIDITADDGGNVRIFCEA